MCLRESPLTVQSYLLISYPNARFREKKRLTVGQVLNKLKRRIIDSMGLPGNHSDLHERLAADATDAALRCELHPGECDL